MYNVPYKIRIESSTLGKALSWQAECRKTQNVNLVGLTLETIKATAKFIHSGNFGSFDKSDLMTLFTSYFCFRLRNFNDVKNLLI